MTAPGTRSYMQIFSRFGLTWHRKVNFSTFSGKLTILHRFFFFVPETLNPIFLGKSQKTRARKCSRSVKLKVDLVNYDAIWCQIGSQFPWVLSVSPWSTRETFPFFPFLLSMDFPWIFHGFPIEFSMVFPMVFALDFPWIFHGSIFHDLSMNYKMFPWWFPVPLLA